MPSASIEGKWKGSIKTLWDHGSPPGSFDVDFSLFTADKSSKIYLSGNLAGSGHMRGQFYVLKNARFDLQKVTFEMCYNGHAPEVFDGNIIGGRQNGDFEVYEIQGKIRVHPDWLREKSGQVKAAYGRYFATVSLKRA